MCLGPQSLLWHRTQRRSGSCRVPESLGKMNHDIPTQVPHFSLSLDGTPAKASGNMELDKDRRRWTSLSKFWLTLKPGMLSPCERSWLTSQRAEALLVEALCLLRRRKLLGMFSAGTFFKDTESKYELPCYLLFAANL